MKNFTLFSEENGKLVNLISGEFESNAGFRREYWILQLSEEGFCKGSVRLV